MQHTQVSQHGNALKDRKVRYPLRHRVLEGCNAVRLGETGLSAICEAQEEAARRIAHRLHDESAQMLATIYLGLANIAGLVRYAIRQGIIQA